MDLQQILILFVPPALAVLGMLGAPWVAGKMRARSAQAISDNEAGLKFRDQLMKRIDQLETAVAECEADRDRLHGEMGELRGAFLELQQQVRERRPDGFRKDILDEAAG